MNKERYQRQMILPELGEQGQEKLLRSSVLLCGAGGLGSPNALYLAAMGIGRIGLLDGDVVSWSNLNRQILYNEADIGKPKTAAAAERLRALNSDIVVDEHFCFLNEDNAGQLIAGYDIMVDCLDNFPARMILNDACLRAGKPFVHAGVYHLFGQTMTVIPGKTACLRCLFPEGAREERDPRFKGVIGPTAGLLGCLEAMEVYKYFTGLSLNEGLLMADGLRMTVNAVCMQPSPDCLCQKLAADIGEK